MSQDVSLDNVGDGVFEVRLNRPERMNALGIATCSELEQAVRDAGAEARTRRALSRQLVNEVFAPEELDERSRAFAKMLASRSATALAAIKRLVYEGLDLPLGAALQVERAALPEILGSTDYAEGLAAFAERRPPRFTEVVQ